MNSYEQKIIKNTLRKKSEPYLKAIKKDRRKIKKLQERIEQNEAMIAWLQKAVQDEKHHLYPLNENKGEKGIIIDHDIISCFGPDDNL